MPPQASSVPRQVSATAAITNSEVYQLVAAILRSKLAYKAFLNSRGENARMAIDVMQKVGKDICS